VLINIGLGIPTKGCGGGFIDNRQSICEERSGVLWWKRRIFGFLTLSAIPSAVDNSDSNRNI
jgi:hypothetical protein